LDQSVEEQAKSGTERTVQTLLNQSDRTEFILADSELEPAGDSKKVYVDPSDSMYRDGKRWSIPANVASSNDIESVKHEAGLDAPLVVLGDMMEDVISRNDKGIYSAMGHGAVEVSGEPDYERSENQWWNNSRHTDENGEYDTVSGMAEQLSAADIRGVVLEEDAYGAGRLANELENKGFHRISLEDGDYLVAD
jgi:uncharacterized protein YejL (UPF0352 family)